MNRQGVTIQMHATSIFLVKTSALKQRIIPACGSVRLISLFLFALISGILIFFTCHNRFLFFNKMFYFISALSVSLYDFVLLLVLKHFLW